MIKLTEFDVISLFVEDHKKIAAILKELKEKNSDKAMLENLRVWLTKHFNEEERLYSEYKHKTGKILPVLQTIRKEHETIKKELMDFESSKRTKEKLSKEIITLLERHKNVEERILYPELDKILSEKEKEEIYWKLKVI